jgi:hypothetical protein
MRAYRPDHYQTKFVGRYIRSFKGSSRSLRGKLIGFFTFTAYSPGLNARPAFDPLSTRFDNRFNLDIGENSLR